MKTAAIIAEYNPFHKGHKYQIDEVRRILGADTAIIAIMSGNFTQRGELSIADKSVRAEAAVRCGVNLVLELPFPHSMSSAEFFATAGVRIADSIGVVDYLVFGSECGDIEKLTEIAKNMSSDKYTSTLAEMTDCVEHRSTGHARLCELAYKKCFGDDLSKDFFYPNNILAVEYIKSLIREKSGIIPLAIRRIGAGYSDGFNEKSEFQSASAIRTMLTSDVNSASKYMPEESFCALDRSISKGEAPTDTALLDKAVISHLRLNPTPTCRDIHDASGGLYNRLHEVSMETDSISSLITEAATKKFTVARLRRAVWYCYLGVTSSDVRTMPQYTQVLAMDKVGSRLLKEIKRTSAFPVITKPASYRHCSDEVIRRMEQSVRADSVFALARKNALRGNFPLLFTPYVKKE